MARKPAHAPDRFHGTFTSYAAALESSPVSSSGLYVSRVRSFLAWLGAHWPAGPDPLTDTHGRDTAVSAYRDSLLAAGRAPSTVNAHLTAVNNFYDYLGLGAAELPRDRAGIYVHAPDRFHGTFAGYAAALEESSLDAGSRRVYGSRVRSFLAWLGAHWPAGPDPLTDTHGRDTAVSAYRDSLLAAGRAPSTVNAHLTAVNSLYDYLGLGAVPLHRDQVPVTAPRVLSPAERRRYLRAVGNCGLSRDRAIGFLLWWSGVHLSELVALDVADVQAGGPDAGVTVRDRLGCVVRQVPLVDRLAVESLAEWAAERAGWRGAETPALFLNTRGGRLSDRAVAQVVARLSVEAGLVDQDGAPLLTSQVIRNSFGAALLSSGAELADVAEFMGQSLDATLRLDPRSHRPRDLAKAAGRLSRSRHP